MGESSVNIYNVQMAYFFRDNSSIRTFGLVSSLYTQFKDMFKTEPQSLAIPDDAPADVPRCIWNDVNTRLTFNKVRLDFSFNVPSKFDWEKFLVEVNEKVGRVLDDQNIIVDRVGLVSELMTTDSLHNLLKEQIQIDKFNNANEANISWLENIESYNVWTYLTIDEPKHVNRIVFDINSLPDCKLWDKGITEQDAVKKCVDLLKGKMINVL